MPVNRRFFCIPAIVAQEPVFFIPSYSARPRQFAAAYFVPYFPGAGAPLGALLFLPLPLSRGCGCFFSGSGATACDNTAPVFPPHRQTLSWWLSPPSMEPDPKHMGQMNLVMASSSSSATHVIPLRDIFRKTHSVYRSTSVRAIPFLSPRPVRPIRWT